MSRYQILSLVLAVCVCGFVCASTAQATVICSHTGSSNPTNEGWALDSNAAYFSGTVTVAGGTYNGQAAWQIATTNDAYCDYRYNPDAGDFTAGTGIWALTAVFNPSVLGTANEQTAILYARDGSKAVDVVLNQSGLSYSDNVSGALQMLYSFTPSTSTYYTLKLQKSASGVDTYLYDGSMTLLNHSTSDIRFDSTSAPLVMFGDNTLAPGVPSTTNFSSVTFENNITIPEPGTMCLMATGLIGLLAYAWRKRR